MAPSNLQTPQSGAFALNDWLGQSNNAATVLSIETILQPTLETMPFQRKFRTAVLTATVGAGQFATFQRKVPLTEMWRLHFVSVEHNDGADKIVRLSILQDAPNSIIYNIARREADPNVETSLYSSTSVGGPGDDRFMTRGGPAPELIGGDTLQVIQVTGGTNAGRTWSLTLRYEILPPANEILPDNDWVVNVV